MPGLRERRHLETKQALVDAMFSLLKEQPFSSLTMEAIAEEAGISRSTAYRRFASKEEIILEVPKQWFLAWDEAVNDLAPATPLYDAIHLGCCAVSRTIDREAPMVMQAFVALADSPTLQTSGAATSDWLIRFRATIEKHEPGLDPLESRMIAHAFMGAIDALMADWLQAGGKGSVLARTEEVLARMHRLIA